MNIYSVMIIPQIDTCSEIENYQKKLNNYKIKKYNGPGICKSENVYEGIEKLMEI